LAAAAVAGENVVDVDHQQSSATRPPLSPAAVAMAAMLLCFADGP